jgi:DNA-binding transcriptional regulator YiaG
LGADISNELAEVGGELAQAMKRSPLGTEEGQRSAVLNIKGMATALRLRKFEYWNAQVMSQEDTYDVIRAGESDETPLDPTAAQMTFDGFAERLQAHIDLVIHSIPSDQAPAPAAQQTTVDPKTLRKVWVKKKWPAKLKEARIALGQSQKQAAPLCHVSLETYKKWEQGRRPPSDSNARNVLAYIAESLKGSS